MVHKDEISSQLKRLGVNFRLFCHAEIHELPKILFDGEQLQHVLIGRYEGGFALFCATDRRVLLVDKKPFYLTIEDIRYDMISDVQYNHRMIDATVRLGTVHKTIAFTGYNHNKLRAFTNYIQEQVMYNRQQNNMPVPQIQSDLIAAPAYDSTAPTTAIQPVAPIAAAFAQPKRPALNPYNMPVIVRRRVSRFY